MSAQVVIVDYGTSNLNSVKRALDRMRVNCLVSSNPIDVIGSDKIVLPGVGHFGRAMSSLRKLNLIDALHEAVLVRQKPVLGICLGMELMAKKSEEGNADGLGWFDAEIIKFRISERLKFKIPQIGWNQIRIMKSSSLMRSIPEFSEFYFVHSYHLQLRDRSDLLNETEYEFAYPSAIEKENIYGVQYHPEKSHDVGARLLRNFIEL